MKHKDNLNMVYDEFNFYPFSYDSSIFYNNKFSDSDFALIDELKSDYYDIVKKVNDDDIILDIGASVGVISWLALSSCKKLKHIYMVEPYPPYFKTLKENFKDVDNWTLIEKIVSDKEGVVELNWGPAPDHTLLPCTTFKKIVEDIPRVDLLKIDIEGDEYNIFTEENFDYLNNCVGNMIVEFHMSLPETKEKFRNIRDNYIPRLNKTIEAYSLDSVSIDWDYWNEHFLEYYDSFVIVFRDNNKKILEIK